MKAEIVGERSPNLLKGDGGWRGWEEGQPGEVLKDGGGGNPPLNALVVD